MNLYYESHVTIDPVDGVRLDEFKLICQLHTFKVADLYMRKGKDLSPSTVDCFCTARAKTEEVITDKTIKLVEALLHNKFVVRRYKTEQTLVDSKLGDTWGLLLKTN